MDSLSIILIISWASHFTVDGCHTGKGLSVDGAITYEINDWCSFPVFFERTW